MKPEFFEVSYQILLTDEQIKCHICHAREKQSIEFFFVI